MSTRSGAQLALVVAAAIAANAVVALAGDAVAVAAAGLALACVLPGWVVASLLLADTPADDVVERAVFAVGIGFAVLVAAMLALHYLPGPLTRGLVLAGLDAQLALLLVAAWRRGTDLGAPRVSAEVALQACVVGALGAVLRLPGIGYAEFQGDEATILHKAAAALQGRADALFVHKKGPAEILAATLPYAMAGTITEAAARLAFAVAMVVGLVAVYQVGRGMFGPRVGFVAGLLLAVNGFFIGFGRIVQYQALVFLASSLAVLAAYRAYQGSAPRRHLALAAVLIGVGVLAHYDAALAAAPVAYLLWARWRSGGGPARSDVVALASGAAVAAVILAAFYAPMAAHPYFREATLPYLLDVRLGGGEGRLYNTLPASAPLALYYNSTYYMAVLSLALLGGFAYHLSRTGPRAVGWASAAALVAGAVALVRSPDAWSVGGESAAIVFLLAVLAVLLASSSPSREWKASLVWFATGLVLYGALVRAPRTHFHVVFPAWCLLAAVTLDHLYARLGSERGRRAAAAGFAALIAVFALYGYQIFVQHDVWYRRAFPERHPPGYWTRLTELPTNGWFGFPYRAGWKAIGALYAEGELQGSYWSNEEELITDWYTRGAPRCDDEPRYYFVAEGVQDVRPLPADIEALGYDQVAAVAGGAGDEATIRIFERRRDPSVAEGPLGAGDASFDVDDAVEAFDADTGPDYEPGLPLAADVGYVGTPLAVGFGGVAELIGYGVDASAVQAGGEVNVDLYWRGLAPMEKDYSVFAHLVSATGEGEVVTQSDGAPGACGAISPMTGWRPGRVVRDRRTLRLPATTPAGRYVVEIGLYDYETLDRLPVLGVEGAAEADRVRLAEIDVRAGP